MLSERFVKDYYPLVSYDNYCVFDRLHHKHLSLDEVCDIINQMENELLNAKREKMDNYYSIPKNCDSCVFLKNNGICGYCAFTLECYDSKDDLDEYGLLKTCPFKQKIKGVNIMKMEGKEFSDSVYELGVLLSDPTSGLIVTTMKQDFYEKFKDFELIEAWECMVDEVNRLDTVIKLHDELVRREQG